VAWLSGSASVKAWRGQLDYWIFGDGEIGRVEGFVNGASQNILPHGLELALNCTPFPYLLYFPVSVYLGQVSGAELWRGLAIQAGWVALFYGLARWVWRSGIRTYTAVGG